MGIRDEVYNDWQNFQYSLKYKNRFFINSEFQKKLKKAIDLHENILRTGIELFRARINNIEPYDKPLNIKDMGAAPTEKTLSNRANPIGISYLYTSLCEETCVNEVRPGIGHYITVAKFSLKQDIRIVNFYNAIPMPTDKYIEYLAYEIHSTFSQPIIYGKPEIEYLPFQFISEFIKMQKYEGVLYRSFFKSDINDRRALNLVIFNENKVIPNHKTKLIKVYEANVKYD